MPLTIKGGASKSKPASRTRSNSKAATKPAAKRKAAPKRKAAAKTTATKAKTNGAPVKRNYNGAVDSEVLKKHVAALTKAGEARDAAVAAHEESVEGLHEAVQAARDDGVSMGTIAEASNTSRQWLYKMGDYKGRNGSSNGSTKKRKKAAKPAAEATAKGRSRGAAKKPAAKRTRARIRIGK